MLYLLMLQVEILHFGFAQHAVQYNTLNILYNLGELTWRPRPLEDV